MSWAWRDSAGMVVVSEDTVYDFEPGDNLRQAWADVYQTADSMVSSYESLQELMDVVVRLAEAVRLDSVKG